MAAITDMDTVINRLTGGNSGTPVRYNAFKNDKIAGAASSAAVAARVQSLWRADGTPAGAATPTTVLAPDNTTAGGLLQADPGGGRNKYLISGGVASSHCCTLTVYDRLLQIGGFSGTLTTDQLVGGAITRFTSSTTSIGNQMFVEINTAIGATARTLTVTYLDEGGNTSTSTCVIGGTGYNEQNRMIPVPLATGDVGVTGITKVAIDVSTGTAGNFGMVIARPLMTMGTGTSGCCDYANLLYTGGGPAEITDACIAYMYTTNSTVVPWYTQIWLQTIEV